MNALTPKRTLLGAGALALLALAVFLVTRGAPKADLSFYELRRSDLLISVVEGGTIEALNEIVVRSDFEGTARIIFIVKEGSYVKKDELLVELDSSQAQDLVSQQQINFEKAQFALTQADQQLTIQKSVVDGEVQGAELKLQLAQIDLNKYVGGERDKLRRDAEIAITNVVENLKISQERLEWTRKLYANGWEIKSKLDTDELAVSQLVLKKEQAEKELWMLMKFEEEKRSATLKAAVDEATENLARVKLQGERRLEQYKADVETQRNTLELSAKKLERDKKQLAACRIPAPQDGLVVYAGSSGDRRFSSESMVEEGAMVRNRQELIKLPDIAEMKLEIKIHEAHINNIRPGQQTFIVLDSMPDKRFQGYVNKVGLVPDSQSRWGNPNLKLYATQILITDTLPDVKPGVSARAEIVITNLQNVLSAPIQAVTTRKGKQVVFLAEDPPRPAPVAVGLYNTKFIELKEGVSEGDRILLSPPFDSEGQDLGGAVIAKDEKLPTNGVSTNVFAPRPSAAPGPDRVEGDARAATAASPDRSAAGEGSANRRGGQGGGPRQSREEMLKQYDKNGDGALDDTEREAMQAALGIRGGGPGGGRAPSEEMLKRFDKNGDGQLDETERAAMRESFGSRRRGTNAPPMAE